MNTYVGQAHINSPLFFFLRNINSPLYSVAQRKISSQIGEKSFTFPIFRREKKVKTTLF